MPPRNMTVLRKLVTLMQRFMSRTLILSGTDCHSFNFTIEILMEKLNASFGKMLISSAIDIA